MINPAPKINLVPNTLPLSRQQTPELSEQELRTVNHFILTIPKILNILSPITPQRLQDYLDLRDNANLCVTELKKLPQTDKVQIILRNCQAQQAAIMDFESKMTPDDREALAQRLMPQLAESLGPLRAQLRKKTQELKERLRDLGFDLEGLKEFIELQRASESCVADLKRGTRSVPQALMLVECEKQVEILKEFENLLSGESWRRLEILKKQPPETKLTREKKSPAPSVWEEFPDSEVERDLKKEYVKPRVFETKGDSKIPGVLETKENSQIPGVLETKENTQIPRVSIPVKTKRAFEYTYPATKRVRFSQDFPVRTKKRAFRGTDPATKRVKFNQLPLAETHSPEDIYFTPTETYSPENASDVPTETHFLKDASDVPTETYFLEDTSDVPIENYSPEDNFHTPTEIYSPEDTHHASTENRSRKDTFYPSNRIYPTFDKVYPTIFKTDYRPKFKYNPELLLTDLSEGRQQSPPKEPLLLKFYPETATPVSPENQKTFSPLVPGVNARLLPFNYSLEQKERWARETEELKETLLGLEQIPGKGYSENALIKFLELQGATERCVSTLKNNANSPAEKLLLQECMDRQDMLKDFKSSLTVRSAVRLHELQNGGPKRKEVIPRSPVNLPKLPDFEYSNNVSSLPEDSDYEFSPLPDDSDYEFSPLPSAIPDYFDLEMLNDDQREEFFKTADELGYDDELPEEEFKQMRNQFLAEDDGKNEQEEEIAWNEPTELNLGEIPENSPESPYVGSDIQEDLNPE